ncbi:hypothetical protein [Aurantiacibacter sp. MUD61]|uniref:hypothetical protein n=1 Tax=Aurantiacibacter sp. MUD61 TaxID=3009083 RepID=UPI0022F006C1|nr:hypothetical protein [Aurantiacibacter sp. MUD61]
MKPRRPGRLLGGISVGTVLLGLTVPGHTGPSSKADSGARPGNVESNPRTPGIEEANADAPLTYNWLDFYPPLPEPPHPTFGPRPKDVDAAPIAPPIASPLDDPPRALAPARRSIGRIGAPDNAPAVENPAELQPDVAAANASQPEEREPLFTLSSVEREAVSFAPRSEVSVPVETSPSHGEEQTAFAASSRTDLDEFLDLLLAEMGTGAELEMSLAEDTSVANEDEAAPAPIVTADDDDAELEPAPVDEISVVEGADVVAEADATLAAEVEPVAEPPPEAEVEVERLPEAAILTDVEPAEEAETPRAVELVSAIEDTTNEESVSETGAPTEIEPATAPEPQPAPEPVPAPETVALAETESTSPPANTAASDDRPLIDQVLDAVLAPGAEPGATGDAAAPAQTGQPSTDITPGTQTFPAEPGQALFDYDDELILQLRVTGTTATDTIIAYGTRGGVYLPLGELARLLDLPIQISDDGNYASGWFLSEERTLAINLRSGNVQTASGAFTLPPDAAQAFEGEVFLRSDIFTQLFPLEIETDLRSQAVILTTLEPFPFEERMRRQAERERLGLRNNMPEQAQWPREDLPWDAFTVPIVDTELRAVSDTARGERLETDLRVAGDLAFMTAQAFISATTRDGLTAAIVELGRRDADGDLLGPLQATQFLVGDVATDAMPLGLRGASGRGAYVSNQTLDGISVFDEIDFRGVLPDGYEVEIYRNDILLGSTRSRVNGQYEFLQIPVDFGLNVFRLVFYGPQGQRREEVRRISVGDGRLAAGDFTYSAGVVERGVNLLGVEGPDFRRDFRYGDWQASAEASYGISADVTANVSAAFFQYDGQDRWLTTAGLRTGLGGLALRADAGLSEGGGAAAGIGLGGRALGGGFRLTHFEYSGPFIDELRGAGNLPLDRATEFDFNTSLDLGRELYVPLSLRARRSEFQDGRVQTSAAARASVRLPGYIASSTLSYTGTSSPDAPSFSQLIGNFDLATFNRSSTQLRGSVGFRAYPDAAITQVAAEISHAVDDRTVVRGSAGYAFENGGAFLGLSAIREFDQFSLALDGQYDFERKDHSVALRVNFSFGRDPLSNRFFVAPPGMASSGAVAVRAFRDVDGDRVYSAADVPLPDVTVSTTSATATTDEQGHARLGELGNGSRAVVQVDPSSLPDIFMAPVNRGIEIVPRAGRFQTLDFPVIELSEVEGTVVFSEDTGARGVSGLRLQMLDGSGELTDFVRTERGGYFFFERVEPGTYTLVIDPEQAERLNLCLDTLAPVTVGQASDIISLDLSVRSCD